jgi:hypothetical protein
MSKDYNHEIGYKTLLNDFKVYQNQTPKGITLVRSGKYIKLQFKMPNKTHSKYDCNCTFSIDGMIDLLLNLNTNAIDFVHALNEAK